MLLLYGDAKVVSNQVFRLRVLVILAAGGYIGVC